MVKYPKSPAARLAATTESDPPMPEKPIKPLKPQPAPPPQIIYVTTPPKPAWRYWANILIVAGGFFACIICFLILVAQ